MEQNENLPENQIPIPEIDGNTIIPEVIVSDVSLQDTDVHTLPDSVEDQPKTKRGGKRTGAGRKKKTENNFGSSTVDQLLPPETVNEEQLIQEQPSPEQALGEISSEINGKVSGFTEDKEFSEAPEEVKKQYTVFISGYVLLTILNAFVPSLLTGLMKRVNPKYAKINPKNVALDKEEMQMLQPSADEVVKSIFETMPPVAQFLFAYSIITAGKLILEIQSVNE